MNQDEIKIFNEDYEILKVNFDKLKFNNCIAIYFDETATKRRNNIYKQNNSEHNFSLVHEKGYFLTDKLAMKMDRFYHDIVISNDGLFKLRIKSNYFHNQEEVLYHVYYFDAEGNHLSDDYFTQLTTILSNRKNKLSNKPNEIPSYIEKYSFSIVNKETNLWEVKKGTLTPKWGQEMPDGLTFIIEEKNNTHSDSTTIIEWITDEYNNKMRLNDFYYGCRMLQNGKFYLEAII